ncbi:MAG: helix-hairpin-helix domain-containing protein [Pirellula sp.]|jgi:hypothetical protein|nr:helix-hairpin-helix domain-containing protein [Pirellula sp.]
MTKSNLLEIPGIGKTFVKDFARIDIFSISDLVDHRTSKNYLYVIRMAVYYANGGRDESKLHWNAWKD